MSDNSGSNINVRPVTRKQRLTWTYAATVYSICGAVAAGFYAFSLNLLSLNELAAMTIGGLVGAVEVLGRYQHAPFRAMMSWPGLFYTFINIVAAWAAYYMIGAFEVFDSTAIAKDLTHVLAAGFGSLVFMRSSVFKVKMGDADIGIGPAAILDALLLVADRGVDRREAVARAQDVTELVTYMRDPSVVAKMLTKYCLALMQNVDAATSQQLSDSINQIMDDPDVPKEIKMDIVALQLGIVVGPEVLEAAVAALGSRLTEPATDVSTESLGNKSRGHSARGNLETILPSIAELKAEIDKSKGPAPVAH